MPILEREHDLYPAGLFQQAPPEDCQWWALYTLARREKELTRHLFSQEITFYAPVFKQVYRSPAGRLRTSFLPLFPSYVFLRGDEGHRYAAVSTGCVSRCIEIPQQSTLHNDLFRVHQLLASGLDVTAEAKYQLGHRVRVKSGPLTGQVGTIIERRGQMRLLVTVDFLQQGASVQIDAVDLEPWG